MKIKSFILFLILFWTISYAIFAQNKILKGKFLDNKTPIANAKIFFKNYEKESTFTDTEGNFMLSIPSNIQNNSEIKGVVKLPSGIKHTWKINQENINNFLEIDVAKAQENQGKRKKKYKNDTTSKNNIVQNNTKIDTFSIKDSDKSSTENAKLNQKNIDDKIQNNSSETKLDFKARLQQKSKTQIEKLKSIYRDFFLNELNPNTIQSDIDNLVFKLQKEQELIFSRNQLIQKEIISIRQKIKDNPSMPEKQRDDLKNQILALEQQFNTNNENYEKFRETIQRELDSLKKIAGIQDDFLKKYRYSFYIFGSIILILVFFVAFYFYMARIRLKQRNNLALLNQQIEQQKIELLEKNEELNQQSEELKAQQETILETNEKLEDKNKHITDSIEAAKELQKTIFPNREKWVTILPNSFILFKPKDIVSGDFYYLATQNNKIFVAVVDCTGHGAPGALMTMLGYSLLNEIIYVEKITTADEILNQLNKKVCATLDFMGETGVKSGMDMNLLVFDKNTKIVECAGAKNEIYYFDRNIHSEIQSIPVTRRGIAAAEDTIFEKQMIDTNQKDIIFYLTTDGFQDQFGGQKNTKIQKSGLKKLLETNYDKSFEEQRKNLQSFLENWKGQNNQIDDICLVAIEF